MRFASAALFIAALTLSGCAGATAASPSPSPALSPSAPPATRSFVLPEPQPALAAELQGPEGLAVDARGNIYVSECAWTFAAIERIDPDGVLTRFAGTGAPGYSGDGGPATSAQLFCPAGLAAGPDGAVYFADHVNNRVRRIDAAGTITTFAGSGPAGVGVGRFSGDGGPATQATLGGPWGIAFDHAGRLYIADRDDARVRRVDVGGTITTVAGNGTGGSPGDGGPATAASICPPIGIAIDSAGNLVIPDACTTAVRIVDGNGIITTIAKTDSHDPAGDLGSEGNAAAASSGSLLIQAGLKIFSIDSSGVITTLAGNGSPGVPVDGSAAVDAPLPPGTWGLALDVAGNLYVADGAASVFLIDKQGEITRFAGRPKT